MKWTLEMTLDFVKLYGKHENLWNPSHPSYKVKTDREESYKELGADFEKICNVTLSISEIRNKLKNLRTTYMQQVNQILEKSSPDSLYVPTLFWFDEMDKFLKNVPTKGHNPRYSSFEQVKEEEDNETTIEDNSDPLMSPSNEDNFNKLDSASELDDINSASLVPVKRKKVKHKIKNNSKKNVSKSQSNSEQTEQHRVAEDEFEVYGRYIATQLRSLNLQKALRVQLQIQNLLSEARIAELEND